MKRILWLITTVVGETNLVFIAILISNWYINMITKSLKTMRNVFVLYFVQLFVGMCMWPHGERGEGERVGDVGIWRCLRLGLGARVCALRLRRDHRHGNHVK